MSYVYIITTLVQSLVIVDTRSGKSCLIAFTCLSFHSLLWVTVFKSLIIQANRVNIMFKC